MSREINKLKVASIKNFKFSGKTKKLFDGGGLFLHVQSSGKYWRFKYRFAGKEKLLSFGVYPEITLSEARNKRDEERKNILNGIDPSLRRKKRKKANITSASNSFEIIAKEWIEEVHKHKVSAGHANDTLRRLEIHIFPYLGKTPIEDITPAILLSELRRIEKKGHIETTHKVKNICGQVFRYAVATGRADRDITHDLRDALKSVKPVHHPAIIEPSEIVKLLNAIDSYGGSPSTRNALKLSALLFVRPGELRQMEWSDIDLEKAEWNYTPSKNGLPFIVPLSTQVVSTLNEQYSLSYLSKYVFPSTRSLARPMSNNTVNSALQRMDYKDQMTAHGFRAMARTVLAEQLNFPIEYIEQQLAHSVRDANGRAYNRTTYLKQRREMMQAWGDYLDNMKQQSNET